MILYKIFRPQVTYQVITEVSDEPRVVPKMLKYIYPQGQQLPSKKIILRPQFFQEKLLINPPSILRQFLLQAQIKVWSLRQLRQF